MLADARVPLALAVAVALRETLRRALVARVAGEFGDLTFHDLDQHQAHCLAQYVGVFTGQHLACSLAHVHAAYVGHRGAPLVTVLGGTTTILGRFRWPMLRQLSGPELLHHISGLNSKRSFWKPSTP